MAKVEFLVSYGMRFPNGSTVTKGSITLDDKKHKDFVALLDASKGAARTIPKAPEPAPLPPAAPDLAPEPVIEEIQELPPVKEPTAKEPDWKFMQKSDLKKWLSATGVKMPRENAAHKRLVEACAKAWTEGSR